jgi:nitrogen fixation/metabolism regulation signal transduction histidine kinase
VNAEAPIVAEPRHRWQRKLSVVLRRTKLVPLVELLTVAALLIVGTLSYFIITRQDESQALLTPPLVASLLVANLVPAMALMVLVARRIAMKRAARSPIGGRGRLHVRLVALFSAIASIPTLLVVIFASLLFQIGTDFWFSERARGMLENATAIAKESYNQELDRVDRETVTMATDLSNYLAELPIDNPAFAEQTGVSDRDLEILWEALKNLFDLERSASRGEMSVCGLYVFTHTNKRGDAPAHQLFSRIGVKKDQEVQFPRQFSHYTVSVDDANLPPGVTLTRLVG